MRKILVAAVLSLLATACAQSNELVVDRGQAVSGGVIGPDTVLGCRSGPFFRMSSLTSGLSPLLRDSEYPEIQDAVDWFLDMGEGDIWQRDGWRLLHVEGVRASVVHFGARNPRQVEFMSAELRDGEWRWTGSSIGGACRVLILPGDNFDLVEFTVDSKTEATVTLLATELACASGQPMGERFQEPVVNVTPTEIQVFLAVASQPGSQNCQGNPSQEVVIAIDESIGDRKIVDGRDIGELTTLLRAHTSAGGDMFAAGQQYCAATYTSDRPSATWNHQSWFGDVPVDYAVDLDFPGDEGTVLYAPADGTVEQVTVDPGDGWGNSVVWTSVDGEEQLHLAHLNSVTKTGLVTSGDAIGTLGRTGTHLDEAHLHVARAVNGLPSPVYLSGVLIEPVVDPETQNPSLQYDAWPCSGTTYESIGPVVPVYCDGRRATIVGTSGDDRLEGTIGADVIAGLQGNDVILGMQGDDVLCGGRGEDKIYGGQGFDILFGAQDDDLLSGADVGGQAGIADSRGARMFGGTGNDVIFGTTRWDRIQGGPGNDTITGWAGRDWIRSGSGADHVSGGGGIDDIRTAAGNDTIDVSDGDSVRAGIGRDTCTVVGTPSRLWSCEVRR